MRWRKSGTLISFPKHASLKEKRVNLLKGTRYMLMLLALFTKIGPYVFEAGS